MPRTGNTRNKETINSDRRHPRVKRGPYAKRTIEKRKSIVENVLEAVITVAETASEQRVAVSTVNSIVDTYLKEGRYKTKQRGGTNQVTKITEEVSNFMIDCVTENNVMTLKKLQQKVLDRFNISLSIAGIHKHLINNVVYMLKIAKPLTIKRNDEETLQKRYDYVTKATITDIRYSYNCIFVDEASFNSSQIKKFARSKKGEEAIVYNEKARDLNITIIAALSHNEVEEIYAKRVPGGTNADLLGLFEDSFRFIER